MDDDNMIKSISCPPIPRSSTLWTVIGIRKDLLIYCLLFFFLFSFFFFLFCGYGTWGSAPHWLLNGGLTHIMATCLILIGRGVLFPMKTFLGFSHFSRQNLLIFGFPLFYFFIFSLWLVSPTPLVTHFALSLLSFLPNFQVHPLFTLFSFLNFACIRVI